MNEKQQSFHPFIERGAEMKQEIERNPHTPRRQKNRRECLRTLRKTRKGLDTGHGQKHRQQCFLRL